MAGNLPLGLRTGRGALEKRGDLFVKFGLDFR